MKKRGKSFTGKHSVSAFIRTICDRQALDSTQITSLSLAYRLAYESMHTGKGTRFAALTLAHTADISLILAEAGYGHDYLPLIKQGQEWLKQCLQRGRSDNIWQLDNAAFAIVADVLALHDQQLALITKKDSARRGRNYSPQLIHNKLLTLTPLFIAQRLKLDGSNPRRHQYGQQGRERQNFSPVHVIVVKTNKDIP